MNAFEYCLPLGVFIAGALGATVVLYYCALVPARQELDAANGRARTRERDVVALKVELATARTETSCALRRGRELQSAITEAKANLTWALARTNDAERELSRAFATVDRLAPAEPGRVRTRPGAAGALRRSIRLCE